MPPIPDYPPENCALTEPKTASSSSYMKFIKLFSFSTDSIYSRMASPKWLLQNGSSILILHPMDFSRFHFGINFKGVKPIIFRWLRLFTLSTAYLFEFLVWNEHFASMDIFERVRLPTWNKLFYWVAWCASSYFDSALWPPVGDG